MRQGWDLGVPWGVGDVNFFFYKIHSDLVCELLTWMAHAHYQCACAIFWSRHPGTLGRGQKVKYHLIWITKSISKTFKSNFVYLLTNERYITYHTGFSFGRLGHIRDGWWGYRGGLRSQKKKSRNSTRFWCVSYSHEWHMHRHNFWVPAP